MPDSYSPLTLPAVADVLALTQLPLVSTPQSLFFRLDDQQLSYCRTDSQLLSGCRLIAFGGNLSADTLHTLLTTLCALSASPISLNQHQPLTTMAAAAVFAGFTVAEIKLLAIDALAEQLEIELAIVDQPPSLAQPGLLLMDMDSTAIEIECIDEIAVLAGVGEQVSVVTRQAMLGELDFSQSLRQRVAALTGADEGILAAVADTMPLMPGLEPLVAYLQANGWKVAIASGGFTYFTEQLQRMLGLSATYANQLEIVDGKLTGQVLGDIVDADTKADVVGLLAEQYNIALSQTVAIGDGANDLKMLGKAALGVAFHAKPMVRQQAKVAVNQGSLMQLLYLLDAAK